MTEAELIEQIDKYIEDNQSQGQLDDSCFSPQFYKKKNNAYKLALKAKEPTLIHFATNGYRSYFYFKSKDTKLYLIESYLNDINDYSYIQ